MALSIRFLGFAHGRKGIGFQPIVVVINFGSNCEGDWAKAKAEAITEYKKNNGDVDVGGARFIRLGFR
jgi:hypothetical protein